MKKKWEFVKFDTVKINNRLSNFIEDESNTIAVALVKTIAIGKKLDFLNLLFLSGDIGTGKSHLAQSIINESSFNRNRSKRLFLRCETFIHNYIQAVRENCQNNFIDFYLDYDILIIDDIHLLHGKEKTQEFFKEILDLYYNENKLMVLTSNLLPNELKGFTEGVYSRLTKSVVVKLHNPSKKTKIEILEMKLLDYNFQIANEILEDLVMDDSKSVMELEGDLITLIAQASVLRTPLTYDFYIEQSIKQQ
jgi:chromosomal replication initiator protein